MLNENQSTNVSLTLITSILGYSIIPLLILALYSLFLSPTYVRFDVHSSNRATYGMIVAIVCIVWSSFSASRFIELLLGSKDQRYIIMYPLLLMYATFAMITSF